MSTTVTNERAKRLWDLDSEAVTAIRMLSIDEVESANSGHPGLPLGLAPVAYTIYSKFLRFDASDPTWAGRDRFILSAGHGSALLYSLLHLFGYGLSIDDLSQFRHIGSLTPGHPEYHHTKGVETTTGPLGQGVATAVGMALGLKLRRSAIVATTPEAAELFDQRCFVLVSDGDLMEGVSHEAASFAGALGLSNLIVLFDSNGITIDGPAAQSCKDDARKRFESYGWRTAFIDDGNDLSKIEDTISHAVADGSGPWFIEVRTVIGRGSPNKEGKSSSHGSPLGKEETILTKEFYKWPTSPPFFVPSELTEAFAEFALGASAQRNVWDAAVAAHGPAVQAIADASTTIPSISPTFSVSFETGTKMATRKASQAILTAALASDDRIVGGSADLAESTGLVLKYPVVSSGSLQDESGGRLIHFGIREHAMAASLNGLLLAGGLRALGSTFLVFSDYLRPALRLASIMGIPTIFVFTHDSIAVGEDGPTHEPIEQLESLRTVPGHNLIRPADAWESLEAWRVALEQTSAPFSLIFTRQDLPILTPTEGPWMAERGARVIRKSASDIVTLVATGSEVSLALQGADLLEREHGINVRVVSMPWRERYLSLDKEDQHALVPSELPVVVVEAGVRGAWDQVIAGNGSFLGVERYGMSGPGPQVQAALGLTPEHVAAEVLDVTEHLGVRISRIASQLLHATSLAAVACQSVVGKGDREGADLLAVEAMRSALLETALNGTVVIGEGAKDAAPMLYEGEHLGDGTDTLAVDIAVDPLEGTNYAARGSDGALSVVATSARGTMAPMPAFYMEKLVTAIDGADDLSLDNTIEENVAIMARAKGVDPSGLCCVVLDKPRHTQVIGRLRAMGVRVIQVTDGDVLGTLRALLESDPVDFLYGVGGAPEGVISAAAARALGGVMYSKLAPQSDTEREALTAWRKDWESLHWRETDLVGEDAVMVASAVTATSIMPQPTYDSAADTWTVSSIVVERGTFAFLSRHVKL